MIASTGRAGTLVRHFFDGLFDLGFLSEAAATSFGRMILGICTAFFSVGLLLLRVYVVRYVNLFAMASPDRYLRAVLADHAFAIAVPMWIVAFVTLLVSHALFPDETDFRVLLALPVTRRLVFAAKLAAVGLFTGLFLVAAHVAIAPVIAVSLLGRWAEHAVPIAASAYLCASLLASLVSVLGVVAMQGVLIVWLPRARMLAWSAALRSVLIGGLILVLPLLLRLPAETRAFSEGRPWLAFVPPAWFLGLERWMLGDTRAHIVQLAWIAVGASCVAAATAAVTYMVLYRRFDRVALRPAETSRARPRTLGSSRATRRHSRPIGAAVRAFSFLTLRRSVLHQGILVALTAIGLGLSLNSLLFAGLPEWIAHGGPPRSRLISSVLWCPYALTFVTCLAIRASIAVPIEQRANWIFRLASPTRPHEALTATIGLVRQIGVFVPAALILPLQAAVIGSPAIAVVVVEGLWGCVLVEVLMRGWMKIPFTCAYVPGQRFVPQAILAGLLSFTTFTALGQLFSSIAERGSGVGLVVLAVALPSILLLLRRARRTAWTLGPLAYEDTVPTEVNPLRFRLD